MIGIIISVLILSAMLKLGYDTVKLAEIRDKPHWGIFSVFILGLFSLMFLLTTIFAKSSNEATFNQGVQKGLDSNISMKYVLITDSLYKKK